ncbi:MAG: flagellin FliC3 [Lachnospiraceae bacterium]|nr:flagellin FliC3 [Lachnospiraceae bacterium]
MRVGTNVSALTANNALNRTDNALTKSMERLSSGLKVNSAKDNPAGIAIAKRMNSQINGLSIAGDNAGDGISVVEIADGALGEIHSILQRMNELAIQASNGTMTDEDRKSLNLEITQLKDEIDRIAKSTDFNGQNLLDGTFDLKGYSSDSNVKVAYYSDEVSVGKYIIDALTTTKDADGNVTVTGATLRTTGDDAFPADAVVDSINGDLVTIKASGGFEVTLQAKDNAGPLTLDMTGIGAMRMQIGANEGQVLAIRIPEVSNRMLGLTNVTMDNEEDARDSIEKLSNAINYVSKIRARLGAYQNRLESASETLDVTEVNMTSSYSRIMDVDMASEMTTYTTQQVLMQAGTQMLAQANERPQEILQLLQ